MTDYAFHVAFNSAVEPLDRNTDIAPSYAWAVLGPGNSWAGQGQRPSNRAEQMKSGGDTLRFAFVDTAASPVNRIENVTVEFAPGPTAAPGQAASPLDGAPSGGFNLGTAGYISAGCNVKGQGAETAVFPIAHPGDFELKVSFTAGGKKIGVDPEMEVIRVG